MFQRFSYIKKALVPCIFFICAALFSVGNVYSSDEGTVLNGAWKMFGGRHLYTDFFSFTAPGSYVWTEWSFIFLGPYYTSARIFAMFLLMASVYCIFRIGKFFNNRNVGITAATLWMIISLACVVVVNYNPLSSYLTIIALFFLITAIDKQSAEFFFVSGFFFGAVTFFLQSKGIILDIGILILLFIFGNLRYIRWSHMLIFAMATSILPIFAVFSWGAFFLYQILIQWPMDHYFEVNQVSYVLWIFSLIFCTACASLILLGHKNIDKKFIIILTFVQYLLLVSTAHRPDVFHIAWNSPIIIVFASYLIHHSLTFDKARIFFIELPLILMLAVSIAYASIAMRNHHFIKRTIIATIGEKQKIYAHPFLPEFYFELGVNDPYPYDILLTGMYPARAFDENLNILKKEDPEYVLSNYEMVSKFFYNTQNSLDAYIERNYTRIKHVGFFDIMKKNQK